MAGLEAFVIWPKASAYFFLKFDVKIFVFKSFFTNGESTVQTTEEDFLLLFCIGSNARGPEGKNLSIALD